MLKKSIGVLWMLMAALAAEAKETPNYLKVGTGYYDALDRSDTAVAAHIEYLHTDFYRYDESAYLCPLIGFQANTDSDIHVYAGVQLDMPLGFDLVLSPSFAPGFWARGHGKPLGHPVLFRSGVELGYQFTDRSRLAIGIYHLSNVGLDSKNPGVETVHITWSTAL